MLRLLEALRKRRLTGTALAPTSMVVGEAPPEEGTSL